MMILTKQKTQLSMRVVHDASRLLVHTTLANGRFTVLDARRDHRSVLPLGALCAHDATSEQLLEALEREERRVFFEAVIVLGSQEEAERVVEAMRPFFGVRQATGLERQGRVLRVEDVAATWPACLLVPSASDPPPLEQQLFAMERTVLPHAIAPRLYLGDWLSVTNIEVLEQLGVTGVVNASNHFGNKHSDTLAYCNVDVDDYDFCSIEEHFEKVIGFVRSQKGAVAVHCAMGVSRSATLVVALLMDTYGLSLKHALTLVHSRRSIVAPNRGFLAQLVQLESRLHGTAVDEDRFERVEDYLDYSDPSLLLEHGIVVGVKRKDGECISFV